jgi:hypothetical protein
MKIKVAMEINDWRKRVCNQQALSLQGSPQLDYLLREVGIGRLN